MTEGIDGPLAVAFLVMVLLGYFSVVLVSRGAISNKLAWALSPAFGTGICSIIFFFFRRPVFTAEFALLGVMFAMWVRYRQRTISKTASPAGMPILAALMIGALAWVTFGTLISIDRSPHGGWDGFAIWNSHARYLYRAGPVWQHYIRNTAHPDYPLLLPAATARLWRYIGRDAPDAPGVQNLLLAISGVTILAATLWELQRGSLSFLLPLLLVGTPFYLTLAVWQYADVPLSVYILATLGLICVHWQREQDRARLLVLAGFTAGCAAWTKNEGLLFVLVTSVLLFLPSVGRQPSCGAGWRMDHAGRSTGSNAQRLFCGLRHHGITARYSPGYFPRQTSDAVVALSAACRRPGRRQDRAVSALHHPDGGVRKSNSSVIL